MEVRAGLPAPRYDMVDDRLRHPPSGSARREDAITKIALLAGAIVHRRIAKGRIIFELPLLHRPHREIRAPRSTSAIRTYGSVLVKIPMSKDTFEGPAAKASTEPRRRWFFQARKNSPAEYR